MSNRWFRFVIAFLAIVAAGAAGYRIFQHERQLVESRASARGGTHAGESALALTAEIKASLHAYVAPGQGHDFWFARVGTLLDNLRATLLELDRALADRGMEATAGLDLADRLAASEQRARNYARARQSLLAGEVIFTETRDLLEQMRQQLSQARDSIAQTADQIEANLRREQVLLALGAAGVLSLALLVLVPPGRAASPVSVEHRVVSQPAPATPRATRVHTADVTEPGIRTATTTTPPAEPPAAAAPAISAIRLADAASVCTDLGRVAQSNEIVPLLARAAGVLSASGVIVWVSSENRDELFPAASFGYDDRLVAQVGVIRRDESNLTASAFRGAAPRTTRASGSVAAALAVPLLTPQGPIGVFTAELRETPQVDGDRLALSTIFAAQLSNLLGSISRPGEMVVDQDRPHAQNA